MDHQRRVSLISAVATLGGFLFGFDIAIINGAIVFLKQQFALSEFQTEMAASALLAGCIFGAGFAGVLSDRYGRRKMLIVSAAIFTVSSIAAAIPRGLAEFAAARLIGGLGIGVASMLSPLYIAEIAPARIRGRLVAMNQFAIVSGILCAYFVSWVLAGLGVASWRWMFASMAVPSLAFLLSLFAVPESPRWLIKEGLLAEGLNVLRSLMGESEARAELDEIKAAVTEEAGSLRQLLAPGLRRPLIIAVVLAILQQVTGVNTILFYGAVIFTEQVGNHSASAALWANVIVGLVNFVCTIFAVAVIDRIGRKPLLLAASGGMGVSLVVLGAAFRWMPNATTLILSVVFCFVACFAIGMGPVVWVLMSELFPTRIRGRAMAVSTVCLWCACTLLTLTFLTLVKLLTVSGAFWLYAAMCFITFVFVWHSVPETKGRTLEQIESWWTKAPGRARVS